MSSDFPRKSLSFLQTSMNFSRPQHAPFLIHNFMLRSTFWALVGHVPVLTIKKLRNLRLSAQPAPSLHWKGYEDILKNSVDILKKYIDPLKESIDFLEKSIDFLKKSILF